MAVKYVKDFDFASKGPKLVRGYMRGGSCGYAHGGAVAGDKVSTGKTPGKGPEHTLGFAKGGKVAKAAPKGLSVMIAVGTKKAPPAAKKGASPVPGVALGMKKGGMAKVEKVMGEYGKGELHSGSKEGPKVTSRKQATAIALSEARDAGAKIPMKKAGGGRIDKNMVESTSARPKDKQGRPITDKQLREPQMTPAQIKAAREAVARGNREPYERMPTDAEVAASLRPYKKGGGVKPYNSKPLVGKGGLSAMPHGKKC